MSTPMTNTLSPVLDAIERRLPAIPRRLFQLNRAVAGSATAASCEAAGAARSAAGAVLDRAATGAKTVSGQARSAGERAAAPVIPAAREVAGQARAQAVLTVDELEDRTTSLIEDLSPTDDHEQPLEQWTRSELYQRAQDLDVAGRSSMSKAELAAAVRAAGGPNGDRAG